MAGRRIGRRRRGEGRTLHTPITHRPGSVVSVRYERCTGGSPLLRGTLWVYEGHHYGGEGRSRSRTRTRVGDVSGMEVSGKVCRMRPVGGGAVYPPIECNRGLYVDASMSTASMYCRRLTEEGRNEVNFMVTPVALHCSGLLFLHFWCMLFRASFTWVHLMNV